MTHWSEAAIKQILDGTFTRVNYEGKIVTDIVSDDFIPGPRSMRGGRPVGSGGTTQAAWTKTEDELLWTMRLRNKPFSEIAWLIDRSEDSAKKRYKTLRVRGGV